MTDRDMCSEEYAGPLCTLRDIGYFFWFSECVTMSAYLAQCCTIGLRRAAAYSLYFRSF